jgi:hypothetical protein
MVKLVIWIDLNAQGVCTYQIWILLILWCSTCWEDSKDYKLVIFGLTELKIWIKQATRQFVSNLNIVSNWTHKIWIIIVLLDSRCSKDSNGISFVIFGHTDQKLWFFKVLAQIWFNFYFEFLFDFGGRHVAWSDRPVPVREDSDSGLPDLKWIGWTRSILTLSVKWID